MGNKAYQGVKQTIIKKQQQVLASQMGYVRQVLQKCNAKTQIEICKLTVTEVVKKLNSRQLSSQLLVAVLAHRSATVGKQLNLFTMTNFTQALKMARQCDQIRHNTKLTNWTFSNINQDQRKYLSPLFGVPISLKDVYSLRGFATTLGLKAKAFNIEQQSALVTCLRNAGAIIFIRSNVPQYCMSAQTNNNLWGRSISPWNSNRAVGGSSGGEGGLISAKCSILGVGSDIGGSIRVPSQHCGIFGLKTSSKRVSNTYHSQLSKVVTAVSVNIPLCIGPLAKSAQDLALFMKVITTQKYFQDTYDPYTKIIQFNAEAYLKTKQKNKKYKIGYIKQLADTQPSPTSTRALEQVKEILTKLGHELIEMKVPNQAYLIRQYLLQISPGNSKYLRQILAGEEPSTQNKIVINLLEMSTPTQIVAKYFAKLSIPRAYNYSFSKRITSVFEYQTHIGQIGQLKTKFMQYWKQKQLDFAICPGFPCQAIPHGQSNKTGYGLAYTFIWNILDMAVGNMPVTVVKQNQQHYQSRHNDMFTTQLKKCAVGSIGLPAGIQVIGLPFRQEQVLGLMSLLQQQINFYEHHPLPDI